MNTLLVAKFASVLTSRRFWIAAAAVAVVLCFVPGVVVAEGMHAAAIIVAAWIISDGLRSTGLPALLLAACLACGSASAADDPHAVCREATVRIRNGTVVGSGTCFRATADAIYVLTNAHVTGVQLNRAVTCEFWHKGHQSRPVPGATVAIAYRPGAYRDVAIVRVGTAELGAYRPPTVAIAPDRTAADYSYVYSVGCAAGRWPSAFEGFALSVGPELDTGDVVRFVPAPAGGRSGSALFDVLRSPPVIIGVIGWRSDNEGGHNLDGFGESSGHGIAMTHREIWAALRGGQPPTSTSTPSTGPRFYVPPDAIPCQFKELRPGARPASTTTDQALTTPIEPPTTPSDPATSPADQAAAIDAANWNTGTGRDAVLLYSDPAAIAPDSFPIQYVDATGQQCPPGGCPPGGQPPYQQPYGQQPYGQQPQDQLFPSWRDRFQDQGAQPPNYVAGPSTWSRVAPWVALAAAAVVIAWLVGTKFAATTGTAGAARPPAN